MKKILYTLTLAIILLGSTGCTVAQMDAAKGLVQVEVYRGGHYRGDRATHAYYQAYENEKVVQAKRKGREDARERFGSHRHCRH